MARRKPIFTRPKISVHIFVQDYEQLVNYGSEDESIAWIFRRIIYDYTKSRKELIQLREERVIILDENDRLKKQLREAGIPYQEVVKRV